MNTFLKLKMKPGILEEEVLLTKAFLVTITESSVYVSHQETKDGPAIVLSVLYKTKDKLNNDVSTILKHGLYPIKDHEEVSSKWFTVSVENDNIDSELAHLIDEKLDLFEEQINIFDHLCSDIASDQEDMKQKVEALYSFMDKSGILYYKQLVTHLLSVMEANGLTDKQAIEEQIFQQIH